MPQRRRPAPEVLRPDHEYLPLRGYDPQPNVQSSVVLPEESSRYGKREMMNTAGYELGIGAAPLASPPNMQARGFRQERILLTHEGLDMYESDYSGHNEHGFMYRARHDGV